MRTIDAAEKAALTHYALPSFVYPAVIGTPAEQAAVIRTLDSLPLRAVTQASSIRMVDTLGTDATGITEGITDVETGHIDLARDALRMRWDHGWKDVPGGPINPPVLKDVLVHELGHTFDLPHSREPLDVMTRGFDRFNRVFTLVEPPSKLNHQPVRFAEHEAACFAPVSAAANASAPVTTRMPRPPPPAEALISTGKPIRSASSTRRSGSWFSP